MGFRVFRFGRNGSGRFMGSRDGEPCDLVWASTNPVDEGTRRVVADGFRIIVDKEARLARLRDHTAQTVANGMEIRAELPGDVEAIRAVTTAAFENAPYSNRKEAAIVEALRRAGALSVSLVATEGDEVIGHAAFSPVLINGAAGDWYGLGPVSVRPDRQQQGIGRRLIACGLEELGRRGARGCVVLGEPAYYGRFGFVSDPDLRLAGAPPVYFQRLALAGAPPSGEVAYHGAFATT